MNPEKILEEFISRNESINKEKAKRIINPIFLALFPQHVLEYCANYEIVQDRLLTLTQTQLNIVSKIIKFSIDIEQDWVIPASKFIELVKNPNYKEFVNSLEGKLLTDIEIEAMMYLTKNNFNYFKITDYNQLSNIEEIRQEQYENTKGNHSPEIILLNKYGMSFNTAEYYLKRYGADLQLLPKSREKTFLEDLDNILKNKGTDTYISIDITFLNNLDSYLNNLYSKLYNEKLYQIEDKNFIIDYKVDEKTTIPIYDAGTEFYISIHSIGMANDTRPEDYYKSWNKPYSKHDNFCNSIITSRSMKTSIKNCIFGFSNFINNDFKLLAANDLGTGAIEEDPLASKIGHDKNLISEVKYHIPDELEKNTRISNNEIYRVRRRIVDGKMQKVNPDYLVYFKESSDYESDIIWKETIKASLDFKKATGKTLPIVIIDCEKCLIHNVEILDKMISDFSSNFDNSKKLKDILELIHTLKTGYSGKKELIKKYLSTEKVFEYFNNILNIILKMSDFVPNLSLTHLTTLSEIIDTEYDKMNASSFWIEKSLGTKKIDKNPQIYIIIEETKKKILEKISKKNNNDNKNKKM